MKQHITAAVHDTESSIRELLPNGQDVKIHCILGSRLDLIECRWPLGRIEDTNPHNGNRWLSFALWCMREALAPWQARVSELEHQLANGQQPTDAEIEDLMLSSLPDDDEPATDADTAAYEEWMDDDTRVLGRAFATSELVP